MKKKKSLGQNFFVNKNLAERIIEILLVNLPDVVVEIGPGGGYFTDLIASKVKSLVLIEKDDDLALDLSLKYPKADVVNKDFLDWDLNELQKYADSKIIFFGSLPYNVSKKIIRKIIFSKYYKNPSFFIIQKEVAQKYIAKAPDSNVLALETALFADCKKLFDISSDSFRPMPKVTSSFIQFTPNEKLGEKLQNIDDFISFLFDIRKLLGKVYGVIVKAQETYECMLKKYNLENDELLKILEKRPQHLSLSDCLLLYSTTKRKLS